MLRNIYGTVHIEGIWRKIPTAALYDQTETITDNFRKIRATFLAHIRRITTGPEDLYYSEEQ